MLVSSTCHHAAHIALQPLRFCSGMHLIEAGDAASDFVARQQRGLQALQRGDLCVGIARSVGLRRTATGVQLRRSETCCLASAKQAQQNA